MAERRTVYSDPEPFVPDEIYNNGFDAVAGLVKGDPFKRIVRLNTPSGNVLEINTDREVEVVVFVDEMGNHSCEPYDPARHGEKIDLQVMSMAEFINNMDFFDAQESLVHSRKGGASKPRYNVEDEWRARGGDPSFKMPKVIHPGNKL